MHGEVRVTVIATGFDRAVTGTEPAATARQVAGGSVLPFPRLGTKRAPEAPQQTTAGSASRAVPRPSAPTPAPIPPAGAGSTHDMPEMEIPTFIRRQMD
jgi:hypothetical protein